MQRIQAVLDERELDALLVTDLVNVRWLTGFPSSNALVVATRERAVLVTDFRYAAGARRVVSDADVLEGKRDLVDDAVTLLPAGRVGFEDQVMTVAARERWAAAAPGRELVGVGSALERLRAVKSSTEIASIQAAVALADDALRAVLERGLAGKREREVAALLQYEARVRGAQHDAFSPIVASGDRSDSPHSSPTDAEIPRDTFVLIDFGVELDGFCSDGTRTYATGEVSGEMREVYELVRTAQAAGLEGVRAGVTGREADAAARSIIESAGHGEHFGHGLGHGVGMKIHEDPRLTQRSEHVLERGNVVSVEPGVYLEGRFGVRIEDLVAVTDDGHVNLSSLPKELTVVD
ncbi:MAG TPA: Xaa-Pro peptidase family protein [Solirubrobacteraceae bacterium]|nr:Xaa-Pro peptidase family protein [Solirubrobacteraceae bacterium]